MKNPCNVLFVLTFFTFLNVNVHAQIDRLNIPNELCVISTPSQGKSIVYDVTLLRSECIFLFGANDTRAARRLVRGKNKMRKNGKSVSAAMVKLSSITRTTSGATFNFGPRCGEAGVDDANVMVAYAGNAASNKSTFNGNTSFKLGTSALEVLNVTQENLGSIEVGNQNFLQAQASTSSTVTVSIAKNTNQGHAMVAIFTANGSPQPIAVLDPKGEGNQSFTADSPIFILPLIKPKTRVENGVSTVFFEVGDPEENGKVIIEEEG